MKKNTKCDFERKDKKEVSEMDREELRLEIERIQQMQQVILESEKSADKTEKILICICAVVGGLFLILIMCIIWYLSSLL